MSAISETQIQRHLEDIASLQALVLVGNVSDLSFAESALEALERSFAELDKAVAKEEAQLRDAQALIDAARVQVAAVSAMANELSQDAPFERPSAASRGKTNGLVIGKPQTRVAVTSAPAPASAQQGRAIATTPTKAKSRPSNNRKVALETQGGSSTPTRAAPSFPPPQTQAAPLTASSQTSSTSQNVPHIQHVTAAEMASCPSYMRGRLTAGKINAMLDDMQIILNQKYAIMETDPRKLSGEQSEKFEAWSAEITKEVDGAYFFSETDLRARAKEEGAVLKFDMSGKAALTVLQHLRRIRALPGRVKRYAVVP